MHLLRRDKSLLWSYVYRPEDRLYRNEGNTQFADVTQQSKIDQSNSYYGLGVVPIDYNRDGWTDIFVANDETPNVLFKNLADDTFSDVALLSGVAYNGDGETEAGMGVDAGDYDNDGDFDLYVTHFFTETNTRVTRMPVLALVM